MSIVCIAGKNRIAVEAAQFVLRQNRCCELLVLTNQTDDGVDSWQPSLKKWALRNDVRVVQLEELYAIEDLLFVSLEYDRLIVPDKFSSTRLFNCHFSCLPEYKGSYTAIWPILDGKDYSGVTLHAIDAGIDTGGIIDQKRIAITLDDTSRTLYEKYMNGGGVLFRKWLTRLLDDEVKVVPQPAVPSSFRSRKSIDFDRLEIDLKQTAFGVHNWVRAFVFREYQLPHIMGYAISKSEICEERSTMKPGSVVEDADSFVRVATVDFDVVLYKDTLCQIFDACRKGADERELLTLVERMDDVDLKNAKGWTSLMVAVYSGNDRAARFLVDRGANVNQTNYKGTSVLMYAKSSLSRGSDLSVIEWLVQCGADIHARDAKGRTLLDYAKEEKDAVLSGFLEGLERRM